MSREGDYLVFAAEQYRFAKGLSGREVVDLFSKYDVNRYILDMFELFHIESEQNMIAAPACSNTWQHHKGQHNER